MPTGSLPPDAAESPAVRALSLAALLGITAWLFAGAATDRPLRTHETPEVYQRVQEYVAEFRAGQVPPLILPEAFHGGGYAFPRFYPPLGYWVAAATSAIAGDPVAGTHAALLLAVALSAIAFRWMAAEMTGSHLIGSLGALLYCGADYRLRVVLQRGALAECWTFPWLPVLALGIHRAGRTGAVPWFLPVAVAGLLLSHTVMGAYAVCFAMIFVMASVRGRRQAVRVARQVAWTLAVAGGLTAWHLLPAWSEWHDVRAGSPGFMWSRPEQVANRSVPIASLLRDVPGLRLREPSKHADRFALGTGDLVVLPVALAALAVTATRRRRRALVGADLRAAALLIGLWLLVLGLLVAPRPVLSRLPSAFGMIQFPWRLLGPACFLSALATVFCARMLLPASPGIRAAAVAAAAALVAVAVPAPARRGWTFDSPGRSFEESAASAVDRGYTVLAEYAPRSFAGPQELREVARDLRRHPAVRSVERIGSTTRVQVSTDVPAYVALPLLHYRFYEVRDANGDRRPVTSTRGLVVVRADPGDSLLVVRPGRTVTARIGGALLIVSALALAAGAGLRAPYRIRASLRVSATSPDVSRTK